MILYILLILYLIGISVFFITRDEVILPLTEDFWDELADEFVDHNHILIYILFCMFTSFLYMALIISWFLVYCPLAGWWFLITGRK